MSRSPLIENTRGISFHVEVLLVKDGRRMGNLSVDEYGYYQNVPIGALGIHTDNNTYYMVEDFQRQLRGPDTFIHKMLTEGKLYGEMGHPHIDGMDNDKALRRLAHIEETRHSHHFRSIGTGATLANGGTLLTAAIKPFGPYGPTLKESFDSPLINTSFSLRGISDNEYRGNIAYRRLKKLVTFDAVFAGGYNEAAKRYAGATESFQKIDFKIDPYRDRLAFSEVSLECFTDSELNDIFGTKTIAFAREQVTYFPATQSLIRRGEDQVLDMYHEIMRGNR